MHETGIFDTLKKNKSLSCKKIALKNNLNSKILK